MTDRRPVFLLVFANPEKSDGRFLRNLPVERARLVQMLDHPSVREHWKVEVRNGASAADVFAAFNDHDLRGRIAVFHFAGHAGGHALLLENPAGGGGSSAVWSEGLSAFLARQDGLRLVVLNGCSTRSHAITMIQKRVPAVIVTDQPIRDDLATEFAAQFFQAFADPAGTGRDIADAFALAAAATMAQAGANVASALRADYPLAWVPQRLVQEGTWPWKLELRAVEDGRWRLADAATGLWNVPPLPAMLSLPEAEKSPYRVLKWFSRADARIFFGRDREIRQLFDFLQTSPHRVLLLTGATGTGKSSLLDAGMRPRAERDWFPLYLRRSRDVGLSAGLRRAVVGDAGDTKGDLRDLWQRRVQRDGRPLIVVLDQLEEAFTRPRSDEDEWGMFAQDLAALFMAPMNLPSGKLILSGRKEWQADIEAALRSAVPGFERLVLDPLNRAAVIEIIEQPFRETALQDHYRLELDPTLSTDIANALAQDRESPLAPTLQIVLDALWKKADAPFAKGTATTRRLAHADFLALRSEGLSLDDFLRRQLARLTDPRETEITLPESARNAVQAGLALDVLALHTTAHGTAERQDPKALLRRYRHHDEALVLKPLLQALQDLNLLTAPANAGAPQAVTRLAHDALAPLVRMMADASNQPGSRARRVLTTRLASFWNNVRHENDPPALPDGCEGKGANCHQRVINSMSRIPAKDVALDEVDLAMVEKGLIGMRAPSPSESKLLSISRAERTRKKRIRLAAQIAASAAAIVIISLGGFAMWQNGVIEERKEGLTAQLAQLYYDRAQRSLSEGDDESGLAFLAKALRMNPQQRMGADRLFCQLTMHNYALPQQGPTVEIFVYETKREEFIAEAKAAGRSLDGILISTEKRPFLYSGIFPGTRWQLETRWIYQLGQWRFTRQHQALQGYLDQSLAFPGSERNWPRLLGVEQAAEGVRFDENQQVILSFGRGEWTERLVVDACWGLAWPGFQSKLSTSKAATSTPVISRPAEAPAERGEIARGGDNVLEWHATAPVPYSIFVDRVLLTYVSPSSIVKLDPVSSNLTSRSAVRGALSSDQRHAAVYARLASQQNFLGVWETTHGKCLQQKLPIGLLWEPAALAFAANDSLLVVAGRGDVLVPKAHDKGTPGEEFIELALIDWQQATSFVRGVIQLPVPVPFTRKPQSMSIEVTNATRRLTVVEQHENGEWRVSFDIGPPAEAGPVPASLCDLAEALAGRSVDESGLMQMQRSTNTMKTLPQAEALNQLRMVFLSNDDNPWNQFGRWFLADRATRTISPFEKQTNAEHFKRCLDLGLLFEAEALTFGDDAKLQQVVEREVRLLHEIKQMEAELAKSIATQPSAAPSPVIKPTPPTKP